MPSLRRDPWKNNDRRWLWRRRFALLGLCLSLGAGGYAQEDRSGDSSSFSLGSLGPTVSLRGAYWNRDKSYSEARNFLSTSAWLNLRPEEVLGTKLFFEGYIAKNDSLRSSTTFSEVREGYLERTFGPLDLRVGRQIIVWGRADKINPTDQWSVRNYRLLATDDEDQRLGVFAVNAAYNLGELRLIGIFQPEWRFPEYPIPPLPGIAFSDLSPSTPSRQFGLKLDHTGGVLDWSLSYANVISRIPQLSILSLSPAGTQVGLQFEHVQVFGSDFAFVLGDYGVRGEVAYTRSPDEAGADPTRFNPEIFAVLGADRSFVENFNLNGQFLYKHVLNFRSAQSFSEPGSRLIAAQENLISNQLRSDQQGVSFRPSYKLFNDTLEGEVAFAYWFQDSGGLVRPRIIYAWNDHLKAIVGAETYFGSPSSFFGRLSETSSAFAELRFGI